MSLFSRKPLTCQAQSSQVLVQSWPGATQQSVSTNQYRLKNTATDMVLFSVLFFKVGKELVFLKQKQLLF